MNNKTFNKDKYDDQNENKDSEMYIQMRDGYKCDNRETKRQLNMR